MGRRDTHSGGGGFTDEANLGPETHGTVKRIVADKGFGFIRDAGGQEYFFHNSAVGGEGVTFTDLTEGDKVSFSKGTGPKGPRAERVRRLAE